MTDFFIHIPRSGGSSLRTLLHLNYRPEKILSMSGDPHQILEYICSPKEDRGKYQLVQGHIPFGLHADLDIFRYFTVIREPVERHFSEFIYAAKYPEHHAHERIKNGELTMESWARIGESYATYHQNTLCQFLSGEYVLNKPTHATYQAACSNLEKMTVFGITERFTESALFMSKYLGWQKPVFGVRNQIKRRDSIPSHLVKIAGKYQELDLALYDFARDLFQKRIDQEARVFFPALESFEEKVQVVKTEEKLYYEKYDVGESLSKILVDMNDIENGSAISNFLESPRKKELFSLVPFRPLPPGSIAGFFKCLLAYLTFGEVRIFNREKVRCHWLGLIDVSGYPEMEHETLGRFRIESDFSAKYPFRLHFSQKAIDVIETSSWFFPHAIRMRDGAEIRFTDLESHCPKIQIREGDAWTLLDELPVKREGQQSP